MFDPVFIAAAVVAIGVAGVSKGGFGAGLGFAAAPILSLGAPAETALALLLPLFLVIDVSSVLAFWRRTPWRVVAPLVAAAALGVAAAALLFRSIDPAALKIVIGVTALGFGAWRLWPKPRGAPTKPARAPWPGSALLWGAAAGFTSTTAHAGGPLVAMHLMRAGLDKGRYHAATVMFFFAVNLMKIGPFLALGLLDRATALTALMLTPVAIAAARLGVWAHGRLSERRFFQAVLVFLVLAAGKLIWDGVTGMLGG